MYIFQNLENDILLCLYYGQSNVGNAGGGPFDIERHPMPEHFWKLGPSKSWAQDYGDGEALLTPEREELLSYFNPGARLFPATCMGLSYAAGLSRKGKEQTGMIGHTVWWGAQSIGKFVKGEAQYRHIVAATAVARRAAAKLHRPLRVIIFWCHGENMTQDYLNDLLQLHSDLTADVQEAAGMTSRPPFIVQQINCGDTNSLVSPTAQAQYWFVKQNRPQVYSAGPMYDCPLADNIHASAFGRMIQGARHAHTLDAVLRGLTPLGLLPQSITRLDSTTVRIVWQLPPDTTEISWSDWTAPVSQNGFEVFASSDIFVPLVETRIVDPTTLDLKLSMPPPDGPLTIRAGMQITSGTLPDGWSNGRTMLEARTDYRTYWHDLGYPIPEYVSYPAMRFEEVIY